MRTEIRQRIEQVKRGEIPCGYKRGKIGIVPSEWQDIQFLSLFTSISNYTDDLKTYPLYSLTIENGVTPKPERYERSHLVKKEGAYKIVRQDDFVYNPMNLRFGAVARYKGDFPVAVSGYYDIFTTVNKSDLAFMDSFLSWDAMLTYYNRVSTGSLVEKQRVHFSQFLGFLLPLPSKKERKKIAEILAVQDRVIALKERYLEEKRRQKKYLMQVLLTGKRRLPGFTEKWEFVQAKKLFRNIADKKQSGDFRVLSVTQNKGVVPRDQINIDIKYKKESLVGYKKVHKGDFIISLRSFQGGIEYSEYTGLVSPAYTVLSANTMIIGDFYKYFFKNTDYIQRLNVAVYGIRDGKQISYEDFGRQIIPYPSLMEQRAIANILVTADQEIEILMRELKQERQKKKALMQLLLSGIVRTV